MWKRAWRPWRRQICHIGDRSCRYGHNVRHRGHLSSRRLHERDYRPFFLQFALTIIFAILVSLLVSFTLTPMMASIFLKPHQKSMSNPLAAGMSGSGQKHIWTKIGDYLEYYYKKLESFYRVILEFTLGYRKTVLFAALVIFVLSLGLTTFIGKEFTPSEDQGVFLIRMEAPIDYSIDQIGQYFGNTEAMVQEIPGVKSVFYVQGYAGYPNKVVMMVNLIPKKERKYSQEDIKKIARTKLRQIPGIKVSAEDLSVVGGGIRNVPIQYSIRGNDLNALQQYAKQVTSEFPSCRELWMWIHRWKSANRNSKFILIATGQRIWVWMWRPLLKPLTCW